MEDFDALAFVAAWRHGYWCYNNGISRSENSYPNLVDDSDTERNAWFNGWDQAAEDD